MSKYSYVNLFKADAKSFAKANSLTLSAAQTLLAKKSGFANFHELTAVANSNPQDFRLMEAALGTRDLQEVIYEEDLYCALDSLVEDEMSGAIAETNAYAFGIDDVEVTDATYDERIGVLTLQISFQYAGEQDQDRAFHGSTFYLDAVVRLCRRDGKWIFSDFDGLEIVDGESDMDRYHRMDEADHA